MSEGAALLPDAAWRGRSGLARLVAALGREDLRIVGGAVRDSWLGLDVTDVDIATRLLPDQVMERLQQAGIKAIPTGIAHGTVTAVADGDPYEVTTLRRDVETDGRRATIAFASEWRDDAARRDFTINALYADPESGEIFDYFGGLADLAAGRVIFIGDAATRIAEDHLRILRFYRFAARFTKITVDGLSLDPASHQAVVAARHSLKSLSRERIADELLKILALLDPYAVAAQMTKDGIFAVLLPESGEDGLSTLEALLVEERAAGATPDGLRRLAALLPADAAVAEQVASRLRLSRRQRLHLAAIAGHRHDSSGSARQLAYHMGMAAARDTLLFRPGGADALLSLVDWTVPELPLKGGDIVARGLARGPAVAQLLKAVEADWLAEDFPGAERVQEILAQKIGAINERCQ
ncbi:MAG TPA: CCA tRNA nucleotidyltransferase [Sphingopyxis sp.]|nr:CCA tRNA nucleotidyltransferase [Sphingopyxis sp.]